MQKNKNYLKHILLVCCFINTSSRLSIAMEQKSTSQKLTREELDHFIKSKRSKCAHKVNEKICYFDPKTQKMTLHLVYSTFGYIEIRENKGVLSALEKFGKPAAHNQIDYISISTQVTHEQRNLFNKAKKIVLDKVSTYPRKNKKRKFKIDKDQIEEIE